MKVPFPGIDSGLAKQSHMYICEDGQLGAKRFVACQTKKPYMLNRPDMFINYIDEEADPTRNPFQHTTRIVCDNVYQFPGLFFDSTLRTRVRPNVCADIVNRIDLFLSQGTFRSITPNYNQVLHLNPKILPIEYLS